MYSGGTMQGQYWRTIEMLCQKLEKSEQEVMEILYFLHDQQGCGSDLKGMADMLHENLKLRKKI